MDFKSGAKVVHKTHGVGVISGIETLNYGTGPQDYYLMKIESTGLTVRFPKNVKSSIVRSLITETEIQKVFSILRSAPRNYSTVWNRRKKELMEKIKSGSLFEIAEVLRDLNSMKTSKELSFGEKEMLEKARARLINEISAARAINDTIVEAELDQILLPH